MSWQILKPMFLAVALTASSGCSMFRGDDPVTGDDEVISGVSADPVIEPELDRRDVQRAAIDNEDWEFAGYGGFLSVEDFGTEPVYGGRVAYHVTEDLYLEGDYARSTVEDTNFRNIGAPLFDSEEEDLTMYGLSVGYTLLPGEVFVGSRWARASAMFMSFGVGNTEFVDEDNVTYLLGFGLRALPADWLSLRLEARDRIWESDLLGESEWKHNFEITLTLGAFF
jgi:outer membrane beta-barrel protein